MDKATDMLTLLTEMAAKPGCHLRSIVRYCIKCVPDNCRYLAQGVWYYELTYAPEFQITECCICGQVLLTEAEAQVCESPMG